MYSSRTLIIRPIVTLFTRRMSRIVARIKIGDLLPDTELSEDYPANKINIPQFTKGKNVVIFGVPGAFCPGCSKNHLPGIVKAANKMKEDGIDHVVCLSVNDAYVMGAWGLKHHTRGKVRMFADPNGAFISAMGLGIHLTTLGGFRSKRFSMVVRDNKIAELNVEPDGTGLTCSLASQLNYKRHLVKEIDIPYNKEQDT